MDYRFASRRAAAFTGDFRQTAMRLLGIAGRLGHPRHRFDLAPLPLDDLLQVDRTRQRAERAASPRVTDLGAGGVAAANPESGHRRYPGTAVFAGSAVRHDHANKTNRPDFLQAQCWVTLGVSALGHGKAKLVLPILSRMAPNTDNRNKLAIALALLRVLAPVLTVPTRLLCDSWFMRGRLVLPLLSRGIQAIAQARIDTALFLTPEATGKSGRGRPRKYGQRLTAEVIAALPASELSLTLHGKTQKPRIRSAVALARFLKGTPVRAVWCEFYDDKKQTWAKPRLLLATETDLAAQAIVELYARRWGIEPLFHNLKRWWGIANLWQQSHTALETWMQIRSTAWTLAQLLALAVDEAFPLREVAPWREGHPLTAGLVAQWIRIEFTGLAFRDGVDPKSQ